MTRIAPVRIVSKTKKTNIERRRKMHPLTTSNERLQHRQTRNNEERADSADTQRSLQHTRAVRTNDTVRSLAESSWLVRREATNKGVAIAERNNTLSESSHEHVPGYHGVTINSVGLQSGFVSVLVV